MAFSFDETLRALNASINTLSRAARDLGDEQPESDLTARMREVVAELSAMVEEFTTARNEAADAGTTTPADVTLREPPAKPAATSASAPASAPAKPPAKPE